MQTSPTAPGPYLAPTARHVARGLADACAISVVVGDGGLEPVVMEHRDRDRLTAFEGTVRGAPATVAGHRVFDSGRPERLHADGEQALLLPMRTGHRCVGVLTALRRADGFDERDERALQEIADRAALLVANTEVFATLQRELTGELLEAGNDAVVVVGVDGRIAGGNARACLLFGYERSELLGEPHDKLWPPHELERFARWLKEQVPSQVRFFGRLEGRHRSGRPLPLNGTVSRVEAPAGPLLVTSVRDLSDEIAAQEQLRFQARVLQEVDAGVTVTDLNGRLAYWSPGAEALFGWPATEVVGRRARDVLFAGAPTFLEESVDALRAGRRDSREMLGTRRDGTTFPALVRNAPLHDERGQLIGFVGVWTDMTDRKAVEQRLRDSERRYRQIVETGTEGVWVLDDDGRTEFANRRMEELLGVVAGRLQGRPAVEFAADDAAARRLLQASAGAASGHEQLALRRADGSVAWCLVSFTPLGPAEGTLLMVADITERVRAQEQKDALQAALHQAQRMETVGQMAGAIAHDFNNLLAVMLSYAEFALEDLGDHPVADQVCHIQTAAERAADLTRQLLVVARREIVAPVELHLDELIRETLPLLSRACGELVELQTSLEPGLWPIEGDRGRVERLLMNLVVNARDAMPHGGVLRLETANVELDEEAVHLRPRLAPGRYVSLTVSDTGTGMPAEVRNRAFDPFFSTKPKGKGTGLGLATVYGIVTDAGGDIEIASEPGQGTSIRIRWPVAGDGAAREPAADPHGPIARAEGRSALVVDDEPIVRDVAARILSRHGYRVTTASAGEEALERAPDDLSLVVTDVVMPGMSGLALAAEIRARRPEVGIVLMSGHTDRPSEIPPDVGFVGKPFSAEALLRAAGNHAA